MAEVFKATPAQRLYQLLLLALAAWAVIYTRFALGPLQEAMRRELGLTDNHMALLQGPAVALPIALCAIPAGLMVDRYPRARLFVIFITLNFAATILTAVATNLPVLIIARILVGITVSVILVAAFSLVGDLFEPTQRGRATMTLLIGEIGGAPAAFALGGTLLVMGGSMSAFGFSGWRWSLLWMSVPLLLCALLMTTLREPPRTGVVAKNPPMRTLWPELWRYRGVVLTLLMARIMAWLGDGAVIIWGAPTFERNFGLSAQQTGGIMATALLVSGIAGPLFGGPLADYCHRRGGARRTITVLCFSMLLSAPAALFGIVADPTIASIALTIFLSVGFTGAAAGMAVATIIIPGELRGLYIAITFAIGSLFSFGIAPVLVSAFATLLGGPAMIGKALAIVGVITATIGAAVYGYGRKYFPGAVEQRANNAELIAKRI